MTTPLVAIADASKHFGDPHAAAISKLSADIRAGRVTGVVGPDGAGKTTLLRLVAGLLAPTEGRIEVAGLDTMHDRQDLRDMIGYMPQRFGLYEDLSVMENLALYADLKGVPDADRSAIFKRLLDFTDLARFTARLAGKLSGGMKQKLGLACAMLKSPRLLLLDEPSVGVDPISRRELWQMIYRLVDDGVGVVWSTAYLDEAENCAEVVVLNEGKVLFQGPPRSMTQSMKGRTYQVHGAGDLRRRLLAEAIRRPDVMDGVMQGEAVRLVMREGAHAPQPAQFDIGHEVAVTAVEPRFEDAFVAALGGQSKRSLSLDTNHRFDDRSAPPVKADQLTRRFGDFVAADNISFEIKRGEIFGLLGPNGAGKSTTFKMMCGLLRPSSGNAHVDGLDLYKAPAKARGRLGYMAQKFSLYGDLSVRQNLEFFAGAYGLWGKTKRGAVQRVVDAFDLAPYLQVNAGGLPLGFKQRLALAAAIMHEPSVLFLDEPTSGVDPLTRREFWAFINTMVDRGVTVMVTTHFMDEAEYCDRVALINRGRCIAIDTPEALQASVKSDARPNPTLEDAFIQLIAEQEGGARQVAA